MANIDADVTLRRLIAELDTWATAHKMVNDFGYGKYLEVFRSSGRDYAALIVNSPNATSSKWYIDYQMEIICLDYVKDEQANKDRVNSDTIAIIRDIENTIRYSNRWQAFSRVDSAFNYRKVDEFGADKAFGWLATFTLKVKKRHGICDIQSLMPEYDFETGIIVAPGCAAGTVTVNTSPFSSVASGGTLDVPVVNTEDSGVGTVGGGKVTIEDVDWTDSDGSPESSVYGDPIVCTPATPPITAIAYVRPLATKLTSFFTYDEADHLANGVYPTTSHGIAPILDDFWNLNALTPNEKGTLKRFTGKTGGYQNETDLLYYDISDALTTEALAFPDDYVICHYSGLGRYRQKYAESKRLTNELPIVNGGGFSLGGFTGDWRIPMRTEADNFLNFDIQTWTFALAAPPFTNLTSNTSMTCSVNATTQYSIFSGGAAGVVTNANPLFTNSDVHPVRTHYQ